MTSRYVRERYPVLPHLQKHASDRLNPVMIEKRSSQLSDQIEVHESSRSRHQAPHTADTTR
jgi:hypothetical protein